MRKVGSSAGSIRLALALALLAAFGVTLWLHYSAPEQVERLYRYRDQEGRLHYVDSLDKVPEDKREEAGKAADVPGIGKGDYDRYNEAIAAGEKGSRRR